MVRGKVQEDPHAANLARGRWLSAWLAVAVVATGMLVMPNNEAWADSTTTASATLLQGRSATSAVWDPTSTASCPSGCAYLFGGFNASTGPGGAFLDEIVRFAPGTGTSTVATLPTARAYTSAVWDPTSTASCPSGCAYVFGGWGYPSSSFDPDEIVRFDPDSLTATIVASLPIGRAYTSAVWDSTSTTSCPNGCAYIFGGQNNDVFGTRSDHIVRYDPDTNTVTTMAATLPAPVVGTSAAMDPTSTTSCPSGCAYIFGGDTDSGSAEIVRYDPSSGNVAQVGLLPSPRSYTSAAWDPTPSIASGLCPGGCAYIYGGHPNLDEIVRYNPSTNTVTTMSATLPGGRYYTSAISMGAVSNGPDAYVFGGYDGFAVTSFDDIVEYDLAPGAPPNLIASSVPGDGTIYLAWTPPATDTYSSDIRYDIQRNGNLLVTGLPPAPTTYRDVTCTPFASYTYEVRAVSLHGPGAWSAPASAIC